MDQSKNLVNIEKEMRTLGEWFNEIAEILRHRRELNEKTERSMTMVVDPDRERAIRDDAIKKLTLLEANLNKIRNKLPGYIAQIQLVLREEKQKI